MALIESCCDCLNLRSGCIVIGFLQMSIVLLDIVLIGPPPLLLMFLSIETPYAFVLVYGAIKGNRICLSVWLPVNIIAIIVLSALTVLFPFASISDDKSKDGCLMYNRSELTAIIRFLVGTILAVIAVLASCSTIVYCFLRELCEGEEPQCSRNTNQPPAQYDFSV